MTAARAPEPRRRWRFVGGSTLARWDRNDPVALRLIEALRVGQGVPVDLALVWTSGPDGTVALEAGDPATERWIGGVVAPAFPPGAWRPEQAPGARPGAVASVATAVGGLDRPFRTLSPDAPPWSDAVMTSLRLLPAGARVVWRLRPAGIPSSEVTRPGPVVQPPGTRTPSPPLPARRDEDARAARSVAPRWTVRAELTAGTIRERSSAERLIAAGSREDGGNGFRWRPRGRWFRRSPPGIVLTVPEVAALFPSPSLTGFGSTEPRSTNRRSVPLGRDAQGGSVGLPVEPAEGRHALFLGETGMGKSSALLRAVRSALSLGGVVLFDPVGDTARRLIDLLPESALARVVWVSPSVSPVGVNALAPARRPGPAGDRALVDLVQALRRVRAGRYADSPFWGPRVEEMVHLAVRAAARYPDGTLSEAAELLRRAGGSAHGVPPEAQEAVDAFRERVRSRPDEVDGARRAVEEIVRVPVLERMLAARRATFSVADAARSGQIVLISGDAADVGEAAARTLLSVHLAVLWSELVARRPRAKVFVIADELQWYANEAAAELWRLGRRFNVHLWAGTQSLGGLPETVRDAALTNSADIVAFRGSPDDAREVARWSPELPADRTLRLARGEAAVLLGKGYQPAIVSLAFEPDRANPARWRRVWEQCRPLWGAPGPRPETTGPAGVLDGPAPARERAVLLALWAGLLADPGAETVPVPLADLRAVVDPEGEAVRALGRRLSELEGLASSDGPGGRVWTVRRAAVSQLLSGGVGPEELTRGEAHWRAVLGRGDPSSSTKSL